MPANPFPVYHYNVPSRPLSGWTYWGESDWMVEMAVIGDSTITVVEIVRAHCFDEACFMAFFTRNIASSWQIIACEEIV